MPKTPAAADADNGSFDDLLDEPVTTAEKEKLASLDEPAVVTETPEQLRIRQLEDKLGRVLEQLEAATAAPAVVPVEKTPAEKAREHAQAVALNRSIANAPVTYEEADGDEDDFITLHVLHSGLTFLDKVWWVGQTVRIKRGGRAYNSTVNRLGQSWLDDLSVEAQVARFGQVVVGEGRWAGQEFNDEIALADAARGDAAPVITIS